PEFIFDTLSSQGYHPTGQLFLLNSYENRVYDIPLEDHTSIIAKFYRPGRWSEETLIDEHKVMKALEEAEIPVVRPFCLERTQGFETLDFVAPYYYCFYPKFGGREEPELKPDHRKWLGRSIARLHNVTASLDVRHRLTLNAKTYGDNQLKSIFEQHYVPQELFQNLEDLILHSLDLIEPLFDEPWEIIPTHGDCHLGNVLWNPDGPTFVDFDDMVMAPAIQDVWMLFHGSEAEQEGQKKDFFEGYEMFREFDYRSFLLAEPLRTLRMIRHAAWIGERYDEEIFKRAFPYYTEQNYWEEFLLGIKEQLASLQSLGV
ncbi:MAG: serine/threonine protein kinase, partial [bacterium]